MTSTDSIELLKQCDSGTKMAVEAIDGVLDGVTNHELLDLLTSSKAHHKTLHVDLEKALQEAGIEGKSPSAIAEGMAWLKTNVKMTLEPGDATIAELITQGCHMGITSLSKDLNKYHEADGTAKRLCTSLIEIEDALEKALRQYL